MDATTIQTYNQMALEYDEETKDFWEIFPKSFLKEFASHVEGKVLNIGSGPGRDGILLKKFGLDVICLDASESMVKLCETKGLKAVLGDFTDLPFEDHSFEGVWAYTSLLHVRKIQISSVLHEIKRILKPGGIFGLGMIEGESEEYRATSGVTLPRLFSFYTKNELEALLQQHGFETLYFESFKPKTKNYLNFILGLKTES